MELEDPYVDISADVLRSMLANPASLGIHDPRQLARELEIISKSLVKKLKKTKTTITINFECDCSQNTLFYVLVDENGRYHTNLSQPELLALESESKFKKAGFSHGAIGKSTKTFDLPGKSAFLFLVMDRWDGIEQRTKEIATLLLANNKLKALGYASDATSWKEEIETGGKVIAKIASLTPFGDYSAVVEQGAEYFTKIYDHIKDNNFKAVARVLDFSDGANSDPNLAEGLSPLFVKGADVVQRIDMKRKIGNPVGLFKISRGLPPVNAKMGRAQRARRFFEQNQIDEPDWVAQNIKRN